MLEPWLSYFYPDVFFNERCFWLPSLKSSHRMFLCTHNPDVPQNRVFHCNASRLMFTQPPLRQERWSFPFQSQRKWQLRGDGCTDLGVDFKLVNLLSTSNPHLNLRTEKLNARFQHFVSLWWNKNCFECKIRLCPHSIAVAPTQYKLRHHLAKCYWSDIVITY